MRRFEWPWRRHKVSFEVEKVDTLRAKEEVERRLALIQAQVGVLAARAELTEREKDMHRDHK
jgi:hypothetical protein